MSVILPGNYGARNKNAYLKQTQDPKRVGDVVMALAEYEKWLKNKMEAHDLFGNREGEDDEDTL